MSAAGTAAGGVRCRGRRLSLERVAVVGVLNVTPDSFSDGGVFVDPDRAAEHGLSMVGSGAVVLDLGGESTRPGADPVETEEEWRRIGPVLARLRKRTGAFLSADTTKAEIARRALGEGADLINDVSGGRREPNLLDVCAEHGAGLVLMHMRGTPRTMRDLAVYEDVVETVREELRDRVDQALEHGVGAEQIVVDPGIGFAKDAAGSMQLIQRLDRIVALGYPVLVGPSRKSFIGAAADEPDPNRRLPGSAAAVALAVANGARLVRVHDVAEMIQAVRVTEAILHAGSGHRT